MKPTLFILAGILGFLSVLSLHADTVILRNGTSLNGKIIGQTQDIVRFQNEQGAQNINKANIRRIIFGKEESPEEALKRQEEARRQAEEQRKAQEAFLKEQEEAMEQETQEEPEEVPAYADEEPAAPPFGGDALWRSLILPGWGQHSQNRAGTGNAYGGAFAGFALASLIQYGIFEQSRGLYEKSAQNLYFSVVVLGAGEPAYDPKLKLQPLVFGLQYMQTMERNKAHNNAQRTGAVLRATVGITAAIYLANVVDVVVFAPDQDTAVHLFASESGAGLRFQTTW
jgi:hypothetical protein